MKREKGKREKPDINDCAARRLEIGQMSTAELRDYLKKREYEEDDIEKVITDLTKFGYLDDKRFAREFFIYDFGRNRSRKKAFYDLKAKGVSENDIEDGFQEYIEEYGEPDEHETAYKEALKVLRAADLSPGEIPFDIRKKIDGRIARRLFTRGFSQSLIYEILSEMH